MFRRYQNADSAHRPFRETWNDDERGHRWAMAATLWDGAKTVEEIITYFHSYFRFLGLFHVAVHHEQKNLTVPFVKETLADLMAHDWATCCDNQYSLTPLGQEEARKMLDDMRRARTWFQRLMQPRTVSQVSMGIHFGLAALKLPAGLLSGSIGLINDATDTLLDGVASLLVFWGLRFNKERLVNSILVVLMLITGGVTFYEAVRRFFVPVAPTVDWFAFLAAILSAALCAGLWVYQRFVGVRNESIALITQSVDSRNHVIVAIGVTAGLIAVLLRLLLLDTIVGLVVASLILKSACELGLEIFRSLGDEEIDFSRYRFGLGERYERFRNTQLQVWILYLIAEKGIQTSEALKKDVQTAIDFQKNPILRELGFVQQQNGTEDTFEQAMAELYEKYWLTPEEPLQLTEAGRTMLERKMGKKNRLHRWLHKDAYEYGKHSTRRAQKD